MSKTTTQNINVRLIGPRQFVATDTHRGAKISLLEIKRPTRDLLVVCYVREHQERSFGGDECSDDDMRQAAAATRHREDQRNERVAAPRHHSVG